MNKHHLRWPLANEESTGEFKIQRSQMLRDERPPQLLPAQVLHAVRRQILESPALRALFSAASGPDAAARLEADYHAQDVWENEGGPVAYAD